MSETSRGHHGFVPDNAKRPEPFTVPPFVHRSIITAALAQLEAELTEEETEMCYNDPRVLGEIVQDIIRTRAAAFRLALGVTPTEETEK